MILPAISMAGKIDEHQVSQNAVGMAD